MKNRSHAHRAALSLALLVAPLLTLACGSPGQGDPAEPEPAVEAPDAPPPPPPVWPDAFGRAALLVADQIAIEGPKGLLDHVALGQDDTHLDYAVETLPEGFRQVLTRKPGVDYVEIKAGLDAWEITAMDRILVIERPGDVPVRVVAAGAAWWRSLDARGPADGGTEERRAERLEFRSE